MKTKEKNQQEQTSESYQKPMIEIIEMETEGAILTGSTDRYNPGGGWNG